MDTKEFLASMNSQIESCRFKLEYTVFYGEQMDVESRNNILEFINENYIRSDTTKLVYTKEILSFFMMNSLVIQFYPKGKPDMIAGVFIGRNTHLHIDGHIYNTAEIDFVCLISKLRGMSLTPYMICVYFREALIKKNICTAYYTVEKEIPSPSYAKKQVFYRPVNIGNLVRGGFLSEPEAVEHYESIFNTFEEVVPVKYSCGVSNPELAKDLQERLYEYSKKTYTIFDCKTEADISRMLENRAFHNFEFRDGSGNLTDFINLYNTGLHNTISNNTFREGRIYVICLSNNEPEHISKIMETIASYCYKESITDLLTLCDILHMEEHYGQLKFMPSGAYLKYYMFNMNMKPIENHRNGLMTI